MLEVVALLPCSFVRTTLVVAPRATMVASLLCLIGCATTVSGVVYVDRNRDGIRQPDEPGQPNVVVTLDRGRSTRTDANGRYLFDVPAGLGLVWARVPDGFRPGAVWSKADDETNIDLAIVPLTTAELASPPTFVVASDTHTTAPGAPGAWDGGNLTDALAQTIALPTPPRFLTVVGDVTQANKEGEFARVEDAVYRLPIPWVPVPGNHDWYDGGVTWRKRWGPDNYSFDVGTVHFVVWDTNLPEADQLAFFAHDLAFVDKSLRVVGLGHAPPTDAVASQLAWLGVDYLFTGHWHANRRVDRPGLIEWGTQTLIMGSIDQSPPGYRIVTIPDEGPPIVEHRVQVIEPHLAISSPHAGSCASPRGFQLLVSAALDAAAPNVRARVDCGAEIALTPRGDGRYVADIGPLERGTHSIEVTAVSSGRVAARTIAFDVCELPAGARTAGDWLQSGGDATHTGATTRAIEPPVHQLWATSIAGGNVVLGTPVVRDGTIVIGVWDLGAGDRGGVVALDLATGQQKWRYATKSAVRASPAIGGDEHGGDVVVVPLEDGTLHGVSLASGKKVWEHAAGRGLDRMVSSMWSSPAIAGDAVYVSVPGRTTALRLRDGTVIWSSDRLPQEAWLGSLASVAVADDLAITAVSRDANIAAHQATTGTVRWRRTDDIALRGVHAAPVIAGDRVFVAGAAGVVTAISLITSLPLWQQPVVTDTNDWSYTITATPAYARGKLIVPTQRSELLALDAASGEVRWRHASPRGPITFSHYRSTEPGFPASPVITGDIVWVPHLDGTLAALDLDDGAVKWRTNLGAPIASAPAPAGDYLIVATFDGVVRAFVHAPAATPAPVARCGAESPAEAGCNRGRAAVIGALAALGALLLLRRRYATS